jgi:hypothetical protein
MPCQDALPEETYANEVKEVTKRLTKVTRFLCWLCGELEADKLLNKYIKGYKELREWKDEHDAADMNRVRREMAEVVWNGGHDLDKPDELAIRFLQRAVKVHPVSRFHRCWFVRMARELCKLRQAELRSYTSRMALQARVLARLTPEEREALGFSNRKSKPKPKRRRR